MESTLDRLQAHNLSSTSNSPMTILIPRIHSINVRLSKEEFQAIKRFCAASGARSISDLVRTTMHGLVTGTKKTKGSVSDLEEYSIHVKNLEKRVAALAAELALLKNGDPRDASDGTRECNNVTGDVEASEDWPQAEDRSLGC